MSRCKLSIFILFPKRNEVSIGNGTTSAIDWTAEHSLKSWNSTHNFDYNDSSIFI